MSKFTSKPVTVALTPEQLDERFSDFTAMQHKIDQLPQEERAKLGNVEFNNDSIVINTPQVGAINLHAVERKPGFVSLKAENSPVPMFINISWHHQGDSSSEIVGEMDVDLPVMLKPLVGPTLQKAVDNFGTLFASMA